jgi:hypothetical protein
MLDHTLEEEQLHLNQDLPNQTFGSGTAATKVRWRGEQSQEVERFDRNTLLVYDAGDRG